MILSGEVILWYSRKETTLTEHHLLLSLPYNYFEHWTKPTRGGTVDHTSTADLLFSQPSRSHAVHVLL